jgi:hypothetical protein
MSSAKKIVIFAACFSLAVGIKRAFDVLANSGPIITVVEAAPAEE